MFFALISGGNANNEANAGPLYANTNNSASNANANIGAHLMRINYRNINLATWQKNIKLKSVLVAKAKIRI